MKFKQKQFGCDGNASSFGYILWTCAGKKWTIHKTIFVIKTIFLFSVQNYNIKSYLRLKNHAIQFYQVAFLMLAKIEIWDTSVAW